MKGIQSLPARAEIRGIPVVFDARSPDPARASGLWPLKRIVVGPQWFTLEAEVQAAVLMHEVHHCLAFHMEIRWLLVPFCCTEWAARIGRQQELDADAYAARQGYRREMFQFIVRNPCAAGPFHPTALERANHLLRLGA